MIREMSRLQVMLGEKHCSYFLWVKLISLNKLFFSQIQLCIETLKVCSLSDIFYGCL